MWLLRLMGKRAKPAKPRKRPRSSSAFGPPLLPEETNGNLSEIERDLNRQMKCPAGKNQVYIRSLITTSGTTPPRIALKCHLRRDIGQTPDVFLQHIREKCCGAPDQCEAYVALKGRFVQT